MTEQEPVVADEQNEVEEAEPDEAAKLKEAIDVQTEDIGSLRKKLIITVPREAIDERLDDQYSELKRDALVPGFRKGRAPIALIQKRFGSDVGDQLISQLVGGSYMAAVEKVELKTLGDPMFWVEAPVEGADGRKTKETAERLVAIDKALDHIKLPSDGPLTLSCEVDLRPEFELPELKGIAVEKPKVEIAAADVDAEIDRYRQIRGRFVPVSDAIEADDMAVADVVMSVDGKQIKEEKNVSVAARPQMVEGVALDLGEALVGQKAGDTVSAEGKVGDDHESIDIRGKTAKFDLTVHDVKRLEPQPMDDEFLGSLGFESEKELKEHTRAVLESQLGSVIRRGMRGQIQKYLLDKTEVEVPSGVSQRQTDRLVERRRIDMYRRGLPEAVIEKQADEMRARASEEAAGELKMFFVMESIAEKMEIDVGDHELNGAIATIAQQQNKRFDRVRDELSKGGGLTALYLQLRDDKILDELLEQATVSEVEGPKKKPKAAPKKKADDSAEAKKKPAGGAAKKKSTKTAEAKSTRSAKKTK